MRNMTLMLVCLLAAILTGCADHVDFAAAAAHPKVGFWYGLWHGMVLPFSWIGSLFDDDIAVYAIYNNGGWYDFGFVVGAGAALGGGTGASSR